MRIFIFSLKVFGFGGIIGVFVLLPINFLGTQLEVDFSDLPNKSLDTFSISNVDDGSNWYRLWVHFCAAYIFSAVVCYLLYNEYSYISSRRIAHFYSSKPQPNQFTVLVRAAAVKPLKNSLQNITLILIFHTHWFVELANSNVSLFSLILSPQFGACLPKFTFNVPTEEKKLVLVSDALVSYSSQYPLLILEFSTCCCSGFLIGFGSKQKSLSGY
ncbi:putative calcium permeable stress-gated cation channel 1 transmembrane domain-containing protein [Rosa chinensis]|uniref:Putative calcium permeable stress-gated cation channel 1 transmembrane domain-containing protein n=1 Tax=Rosa chinensis TaxID=74649 RepID=A0A2P6QTY8_ROSCH|nr:putative calcium permeable stress-gated cation channel 1 transmembrane domain-containing protein [Rosa chinensis]